MRLADLLGAAVVDADGRSLGHVRDVHLRREGTPVVGEQALVGVSVDSLVLGRRGIGIRLGYAQGVVTGPAPLRAALRAWTRDCRVVPWRDVAGVTTGVIRLRVRGADLPTLREAAPRDAEGTG